MTDNQKLKRAQIKIQTKTKTAKCPVQDDADEEIN